MGTKRSDPGPHPMLNGTNYNSNRDNEHSQSQHWISTMAMEGRLTNKPTLVSETKHICVFFIMWHVYRDRMAEKQRLIFCNDR